MYKTLRDGYKRKDYHYGQRYKNLAQEQSER